MWYPHHTTPQYHTTEYPPLLLHLLYCLCYTVGMNKNNEPDYIMDSAMLEPYRLENGGIGWRAIPVESIAACTPEPETVTIDCEDCDGQGDYETMTPQAHGETSYKVFTCETCDGLGTVEVEEC